MPHLRSLEALRARLQAELNPRHISHATEWGNPRVMTEALQSLRRDLGGDGGRTPTDDLLRSSLQQFVNTRQVASFTELKYVCYGVTVPVGKDAWRLIDKQTLFDGLLDLVKDYEAQPKQYRRCYQGLLTGYFGFDRYATVGDESGENWLRLRSYLSDQLQPTLQMAARRATTPDWLQTLNAHQNLLTNDPCSRYADGLNRGDSGDLKEVCAGLGIAGSSWVWQDALMAYVHLVCAGSDANFLQGLTRLLDLVAGRADITLPSALATKATAMIVIRYSVCASQPEHAELRDTCLHWIGNPWLKRTAWDAHVNHEPARQMVNGWLKRRLIKDFFELLAQDGAADLRRLNYWLKWEPQITDMWFVLGSSARDNHSAAFMELRKRMSGRDRVLTDNNHQNNAFVMRIGPLLVIEFGVTGNACYTFAAADFRTSLERKIFSIAELKQKTLATRLSHMSHWEGRFDYELKKLLQSVPVSKGELRTQGVSTAPTPTSNPIPRVFVTPTSPTLPKLSASPVPSVPTFNAAAITTLVAKPVGIEQKTKRKFSELDFDALLTMCSQHHIEWEDNRFKRGALWILIPDRSKRVGFSSLLDRYGFRYTEGKGFWLKDED